MNLSPTFAKMTVTAANGVKFNVRVPDESGDLLVEFFDARYPHTEHGQFVSRYYVSTIQKRNRTFGLCLDGGIEEWSIDSVTMRAVHNWLDEVTDPNGL